MDPLKPWIIKNIPITGTQRMQISILYQILYPNVSQKSWLEDYNQEDREYYCYPAFLGLDDNDLRISYIKRDYQNKYYETTVEEVIEELKEQLLKQKQNKS